MADIDTRITPALHPDNVTKIDGYGDDTKDILAPTQTAFSTDYEGIRSVIAAREQADRNPGWNEDQKLLQVDSFAAKHLAKITRTFDNTRNRLVQSITYIEGELTTPIEAQAAGGVAAEVLTRR